MEKQFMSKRHVINRWLFVLVSLIMAAIFACNNPITDYLKVKYTAANMALSSANDEDGDITTQEVNAILNQGTAAPFNSNGKTYIKDLIMSSDDDSPEAAKSRLTTAGYEVIDQNMNEGTNRGYVYLGYKITTDKTEAITDISIMNMKGDYRLMDYADIAKEKQDNLNSLVDEVEMMLTEYRTNYYAGSATAKIAYIGLNKLSYTKPGSIQSEKLGDILLNPNNYNYKFLYDMLLMANSAIVSGIYNYLTFAVESPTHTVDNSGKVTKKGDAKSWIENIEYKNLEDEWALHEARVYGIFSFLEEFSQGCQNAILKYEENNGSLPTIKKNQDQIITEYKESDMETAMDTDTESIYLASYMQLQKFPYGDGATLADLFVPRDSKGKFLPLVMENFAPFVKALSKGQYATVHAGNFITLLNNVFLNQEGYDKAVVEIENTFEGKTIDLFYGVDTKIFDAKVGVTDAAYRQMSARNNYDVATEPDSTLLSEINMWVGVGTSVIMSVTGSFAFIAALGALFPTLFAKFATATAILSFTKLAVVGTISSILNWASLALIVVVLLTMLGFWIADLVDYYNPTYSAIPSLMYDIEGNQYLAYKAVKDLRHNRDPFNNGDLNNFRGMQWNAIYVTKDARAGSPLMLNNNISGGDAVFKIQRGYKSTPSGYEPVSGFGEKAAVNTNSYNYRDDVGGIYLYYLVDGVLTADKVVQRRKYISRILLRTEKDEASAKYYLDNKGFEVINYNLTSGLKDRATFIGIQTTDDPKAALTDIRIAYGTNQDQIMFGDSSYGMCGFSGLEPPKIDDNKVGPISNEEYALYSTADKQRGSPILSNLTVRNTFDRSNSGAEPINLFSGGAAFNFRVSGIGLSEEEYLMSPTYVYFMPSVVYTSGVKYFGGLYAIRNIANASVRISESKARKYFHDKFDGTPIDPGFYPEYKATYGGTVLLYTTTYNPKRAMGDIIMFKQMTSDPTNFVSDRLIAPETIAHRGLGYVVCELIQKKFEMFYGEYTESSKYNKIVPNMPIYVMPATKDYPALVMDKDIRFFDADSYRDIPYGYRCISSQEAYYETNNAYFAIKGKRTNQANTAFIQQPREQIFIITNRPQPVMPKYIKTVVPSFSNIEDYAIDYARMGAASVGAEKFVNISNGTIEVPIPYNLNAEEDEDKFGLLGLNYTNKKSEALRDVALYYVKGTAEPEAGSTAKTHDVPPTKITRYGIEYTRASTNAIYAGRLFYVYFYVSHQSIAGEPINKIYFDKKMMDIAGEVSKVLSTGVDSIQGFYYMHIERQGGNRYITHIQTAGDNDYGKYDTIYNKATYNYFGEAWVDKEDYSKHYLQMYGCTTYVQGNLNENTDGPNGGENPMCRLGFATGPKSRAITDIVARTIPGATDWNGYMRYYESLRYPLVINGITYEYASSDVNKNGVPINLYITRDRRAGSPITALMIDNTLNRAWQGGMYNPYWDQWEVVRFSTESGQGKNAIANLNLHAKADDDDYSNKIYIKYLREDYSTGKGNTSVASVFSDSTVVLIICFAVVASSGLTALVIYGIKKKRKKGLLNN